MSSLKAFAKEAKRNAALLPQKKKSAQNGNIASSLSKERVQESSEEEEESAEDSSSDDEPAPSKQKAKSLPKINGKAVPPKAVAPQDSSSEDSDSDSDSSDSDAHAQPAAKIPVANKKATAPKKVESSASGSTSDSSSSGDSSAESEPEGDAVITSGAKTTPSVSERARQAPKDPKTVTFTQPDSFVPPTGFKLQSISDTARASQLLNKSSLKGKQIWYITAPASVSKEAIETMVWPRDVREKAVINFNGTEYGFVEGTAEAKASTKFMVPDSSEDGYRSLSKNVDNILHLQQKVELPTSATQGARATVPAKKPVREQPKGLKMRFKPSGFGDGEAGEIGSSSDEESPAAPVRFRKPASLSAESSEEESESDSASESSSGSDVEMNDAPPPALVKPTTPKTAMVNKKSTAILPPTAGALKRKHVAETPEKISSSSKKPTDTSVLNNVKKIASPQKQHANKPPVLTEKGPKLDSSIPPAKRVKPNKAEMSVSSQPSFTPRDSSATAVRTSAGQSAVPQSLKSIVRPAASQRPSILKHSSSSSLKESAKQPPIPAFAVQSSPLPSSSASLSPPKSKSKTKTVLPQDASKATSALPITPVASSRPALPKKMTVNQVSAPVLSSGAILPPPSLLRRMSSQPSVPASSAIPSAVTDNTQEESSQDAADKAARKALKKLKKMQSQTI